MSRSPLFQGSNINVSAHLQQNRNKNVLMTLLIVKYSSAAKLFVKFIAVVWMVKIKQN